MNRRLTLDDEEGPRPRLTMSDYDRIVMRILLALGAVIACFYLYTVVISTVQRHRLDRMEAAITAATYPRQTYAQYRDTLYNRLDFKYVREWERSEETPGGGRSVGAVTHKVPGIFKVDILVTAPFDRERRLLGPVAMQRRTHGF
jgi:hypothetical protein